MSVNSNRSRFGLKAKLHVIRTLSGTLLFAPPSIDQWFAGAGSGRSAAKAAVDPVLRMFSKWANTTSVRRKRPRPVWRPTDVNWTDQLLVQFVQRAQQGFLRDQRILSRALAMYISPGDQLCFVGSGATNLPNHDKSTRSKAGGIVGMEIH